MNCVSPHVLVKYQLMKNIVECTTALEAVDLLRYCLRDGDIVPGRHFREELSKEGLTMPDAYAVMRTGMIYDPPESDIRTGETKWRIQGREPSGKMIAIVFSFKAIDRAFLITVVSINNC